MTNELLIFSAKVFGVGVAFLFLNAIIYYLVAKVQVVYPKNTFCAWAIIPAIIAMKILSNAIETHFNEIGEWQLITYPILLLAPFLYLTARIFRKKLPPDQIKSKA